MASTAMQPFVPASLGELYELCEKLAKSDLMPEALRGKPGNCAVVIMTGQELGLGPMLSARTINVIKGKSSLSADLMGALVQRSSVCEYFMPVETTATQAVYETKRRGCPRPVRLSWTIRQAQAAGLVNQPNWKAYPEAMLRARCEAALARMVYPDIVAGIYDPDELGAPSQPVNTYVDATVVESVATDDMVVGVAGATPAVNRLDPDVLFQEVANAPTNDALNELKDPIRAFEKDSPEDYKRLVYAWKNRNEQLNPPSRADSIKARIRAAKETPAAQAAPADETATTPTEEVKP
jgi:hypothetical protein